MQKRKGHLAFDEVLNDIMTFLSIGYSKLNKWQLNLISTVYKGDKLKIEQILKYVKE